MKWLARWGQHGTSERWLAAGLWLASIVAGACGGAQPSPSAASAQSPPASAVPTTSDESNSLSSLREKLASAEKPSELNLAAKGFGPKLGTFSAETTSVTRARRRSPVRQRWLDSRH